MIGATKNTNRDFDFKFLILDLELNTTSPLHSVHEGAGAEFQPYGETPIVSTFGEPQAEYAAVRKSAAIFDFPQCGVLELSGKDRHAFVNNLLTNQTYDKQAKTGLAPGTAVYAFFLNLKGRIVADMNVIELGDRTLLEMDGRMVEPVRQAFDKFLFVEQVKMTSRVGVMHEFFVTGPRACESLDRALEAPLKDLQPMRAATARLLGNEIVVFRDDVCGVPGYVLICPTDAASSIWAHFAATTDAPADAPEQSDYRFRGLARPAGWAVFNTTRIEAGRPLFGVDFDETILPAETGQLSRAVSFTKGCYLGQEIVARMHARGQAAKQLVGIRMEENALPFAGTKIYDDKQNEIGGVTSSTVSPILSGACLCLGYVKKPFTPVGTKLTIPAEGQMRDARVSEVPFVR
jgi:folate-binding protein YgfZ